MDNILYCNFICQCEIDRGLKDVKEQREQLFRKLEALRAQGIELGPNLAVIKNDLPSKSSPGEIAFYKEHGASTPTLSPNLAPTSGGNSGIRFFFFNFRPCHV